MSKDFKTLLFIILTYVLLVATFMVEIQNFFVLSDFAILLCLVVFVSVVPAIGGVIFKWMNAEAVEDEAERERLAASRTKIVFTIAVIVIIAIAIRAATRFPQILFRE